MEIATDLNYLSMEIEVPPGEEGENKDEDVSMQEDEEQMRKTRKQKKKKRKEEMRAVIANLKQEALEGENIKEKYNLEDDVVRLIYGEIESAKAEAEEPAVSESAPPEEPVGLSDVSEDEPAQPF